MPAYLTLKRFSLRVLQSIKLIMQSIKLSSAYSRSGASYSAVSRYNSREFLFSFINLKPGEAS